MGNKQYNPDIHHRRSIRLNGYDYSNEGFYSITLVCQNRAWLFGKIENGVMILNDSGIVAKNCWIEIPDHFPHAILHEFIIMPNHIHGIIELTEIVGANNHSPRAKNFRPNRPKRHSGHHPKPSVPLSADLK